MTWMTLTDVSKKYAVGRRTVVRWAERNGVKMQRSGDKIIYLDSDEVTKIVAQNPMRKR